MSIRLTSSWGRGGGAMVLVAAALAAFAQERSDNGSASTRAFQLGEELFAGRAALYGKPRGHTEFMPTAVVRCVNCHGVDGARGLSRALVLEPQRRRNGPPSAYDEAGFCKMLRTGIDPASILIDHAMPVYDLPREDCAGLWSYVTRSAEVHASH